MITLVTKQDNDSACIRTIVHQLIDQGIRFKGWEEQELMRDIPHDLEKYPALIIDEDILRSADDKLQKRLTEYAAHNHIYIIRNWASDKKTSRRELEDFFAVEMNMFQASSGLKKEETPALPEDVIFNGFLKRALEYFASLPEYKFFSEYFLHFLIGCMGIEGTKWAPDGWTERINSVMEYMYKKENINGDHDQVAAWMLAPIYLKRTGIRRPAEFLLYLCDEIISRRPRTPEGLLSPGGFKDDPLLFLQKNTNMFGINSFTTSRRNLVLNEQLHFLGGTFAAASAISGDMKYMDEAMKLLDHIEKVHRDPADGLLFHASLRGETVGVKWGRGNTHALLGAFYMLQTFPDMPHGYKEKIITFLDRSGKALLKVQADSGLWRNILDNPATQEETSCSVIITYIYSWCINNGLLERDIYESMIKSARNKIMTKFWRGFGSGNCRGSFPAYKNPDFYICRGQHIWVMPLIAPALVESGKLLANK